MQFLVTYLRFYSNAVKIAGILTCAAFALAILGWLRPVPSAEATLLGDVHAIVVPPPAAAVVGYIAEPQARPITQPLWTAARHVTADLLPDAQYQSPLLAALNCARRQQGEPPLALDAVLSKDAAGLWKQMMLRPDTSLSELVSGRFTQVSIVPLTLFDASPHGEAVVQTELLSGGACTIGGADLTTIDFRGLSAVGLAVFPDPTPHDGLDDSSAVIVAK